MLAVTKQFEPGSFLGDLLGLGPDQEGIAQAPDSAAGPAQSPDKGPNDAAGGPAKEGPANAVKLEGAAPKTIEAIKEIGIPVMGHIGFTPQSVNQLGGYKIQGKDEDTAAKLIEQAKPVMLGYVPHGGDVREEWRGLLLPLVDGSLSVVTPTFYPHEEDQLFLVREREQRIRLTGLLEYTGYFSQFRFALVDVDSAVAEKAKQKPQEGDNRDAKAGCDADAEDDFQDLWRDL